MSVRIPAATWNRKMIEPHARCVALSGVRTKVSRLTSGQMLDLTAGAFWRHPWFTEAKWNGEEERWEATIRPGFVNGEDPLVPGVGEKGADVDLVDGPSIPLNGFRNIPGEEAVPPFFAALGVRDEEGNISIDEGGGVAVDLTPDEQELPPPRYLVAMDFYLAVARPTYQPQITVTDGSGISGQVVDYRVSYDTTRLDQVGQRARMMQAPKFPAVQQPTFLERLQGSYQDPGEDRKLVSTVYLLSPESWDGGEPDESWTPYAKHELFWPLMHGLRIIPPTNPQPLRFSGTGLPMADMVVGQWLAQQNDLYQRILAADANKAPEGRFWSV